MPPTTRKVNLSKSLSKEKGQSKFSPRRNTLVHYATVMSSPNTYCYTVMNRMVKVTSEPNKITCNQCMNQYRRKHGDSNLTKDVV